MMTVPEPQPTGLSRRRDEIVERLCEHFAQDDITVEEFEQRLDAAHAASTGAELNALLSGLPARPAAGRATPAEGERDTTARPARTGPAEYRGTPDIVVGVLGGAERRGAWTPSSRVVAMGVMGGVDLDFREARLRPGVTEVIVVGFMGGVDIVVPPDLPVQIQGLGVLGGFGHPADARQPLEPGRPESYAGGEALLRIRGVALLGGVDVDVRLPGESAGDARRRRRRERRELRRAHERNRLPGDGDR